jgi:hypothetical protein
MKRSLLLGVLLILCVAASASAQVGKGLSGSHYNLNIIGVPKDKPVPMMTDSSRHTVFVPLQSGGDVARTVKIFYVAGDHFEVLDGNATDDNEATIMVPSIAGGELCYDVYAAALGKPNGNAVVAASCIMNDLIGECTDALLMGGFTAERGKGKPKQENISDIFRADGCIDANRDGTCNTGDTSFTNTWIFNLPQLVEYFWDFDNNGLKLLQVRFYETTCGSIVVVP